MGGGADSFRIDDTQGVFADTEARAQIAAKLERVGRVLRRPRVTVTNVATSGRRSLRPRLILRATNR